MAKKTKRAAAPVEISKTFNSLYDFSAWLASTPITDGFKPRWGSETMDKDFTGTKDFTEANEMMLSGWDYGKEEVTKIMMDRAASVDMVKRLALSYVGAVPCVPAYLAGSPKNMLAIRRRPVSRPVVSIFYNCSVPAYVAESSIMTAAAKLFNVVRGLELGGVSVELWAGTMAEADGININSAIRIKAASQPLNVLNMCYPCVHPSFNRRHQFAFIERCGAPYSSFSCYGAVVSTRAEMEKRAAKMGINNAVCLNYQEISGKEETEIAKMIH